MPQVGLFYASSTGNTESVAEAIQGKLGSDVTLYNLASCDVSQMAEYSHLILGASTWGEGELQDDWEGAFDALGEMDFSGKTVALFGLGDQEGYDENFLDAMGIIHDKLVEKGAKCVGYTSTEGFEHSESKAEIDGKFCGLAIDEDNQDDLTEERIDSWVEQLKADFA